MRTSSANAVPGVRGKAAKPLPQSENEAQAAMWRHCQAVRQANGHVTFAVKNVSSMFHAMHFETFFETCNRQGDRGKIAKAGKAQKNSRRVPAGSDTGGTTKAG